MSKQWSADEILELMRGYQPSCILAAAAELELFDLLAAKPLTAQESAQKLDGDLRGTTILLDALVALKFLDKHDAQYSVPESVAALLTHSSTRSVLAMTQHQANCLRRWSQLAQVVKTGKAAERTPSIRGEEADYASFITAMDNVSGPIADRVVFEIQPLEFHHLLDVGGASGTWTIAFLRAHRHATATIFDLPHVIPLAEQRLTNAGLRERVKLVAGDFYTDSLPKGADFVWLSAIVHQNSREQNRALFAKVFAALADDGRLAIRDILMNPTRTAPVAGALFAANMLVGTPAGGTFTFEELKEDLASAGFRNAGVLRRDEGMNSVVIAEK
jgi:predicted O-methyltransferase YrrM